MNWRKHLRDRLDVTQLDGPNDPKVTDEEILNVLREADDEYLSRTEIQDELPIGDQTSNRLNALEEENRVVKREMGLGNLWKLHPSEPETPMNPRLGVVVPWSAKMRYWSQQAWEASRSVAVVGVLLIIVALSAAVTGHSFPFVTWQTALTWGYVTAIVSAAFMGCAWVLRLGALAAPRVVERLLLE